MFPDIEVCLTASEVWVHITFLDWYITAHNLAPELPLSIVYACVTVRGAYPAWADVVARKPMW